MVTTASDEPRRMDEFDTWTNWNSLIGKNALLVLRTEFVPASLASSFASIEPLGRELEIRDDGEVLRTFYFYRARQLTGIHWSVPSLF